MAELEVNPIGTVQYAEEVETRVLALATAWREENPKPSWWQFWKKGTSLYKATRFIIGAIDEMILLVDSKINKGEDKKATVLAAISLLYDYVVREAMPIWLKPFAGKIKKLIIEVLVSTAIDWIVTKYREGAWRDSREGEHAEVNQK